MTEPSASKVSSFSSKKGLRLVETSWTLAICRLPGGARLPRWVLGSAFSAVTRTPDELSIVCEADRVPASFDDCHRGWRAIRVAGTLDFSLIGVLASLAVPLADARIGIFCVSTHDTDYLLVREGVLQDAKVVLERAGHVFEPIEGESSEGVPSQVAAHKDGPAADRSDESADEASSETNEDTQNVPVPAVAESSAPRRRRRRRRSSKSEADSSEEAIASQAASTDGASSLDPFPQVEDTPPGERLRATPQVKTVAVPAESAAAELAAAQAVPRAKIATPVAEPVKTAEPETASETEPEAETDEPAAKPSASARAGESIAAANRRGPSDDRPHDEREADGDDAQGLFTGAIPQDDVETVEDSFESVGLSAPIVATLHGIGFKHPTPIQAAVLPMALEGSDIIGLAETGSGKTGAFGLPLVEKLVHGKGLRGLILCPTREIALQTKAFLDIFGREHNLETAVVIGGVKMQPQIDALRRGPDIIVATPGRLADHMRRRNVRLDKIEELVLDEADHMLDLGFLPQIQEILVQVPEERRTMMFSATMPALIERLASRFMRDPYTADLRPVNRVAAGIKHRLYLLNSDDDKKRLLVGLLEEIEGSTLVFVRRKVYTEWLARQLEVAGLPVERIHSDRTQAQRVRALKGFREGKYRILVATDVAARGIDVPRLQHVVNFGLPDSVEDYVHRAGRTARGNAVGIVSSIGTWQDKPMVKDIEEVLGFPMPRHKVEGISAYRELKPRRSARRRRLL